MKIKKIKGGVITTSQAYQEIVDDEDNATITPLNNVTFDNLSDKEITCVFNNGDEILIFPNETIKFDNLAINSIKVKEVGSKVRFIGVG